MKKIIISFIVGILLLGNNIINAASYNFNFSGPTEATNGQTVTLTITGSGLTGKVKLSSTNASLSSSSVWVEKNSVNVTAKITGFPAKITATPSELTDNDYNIVSLGSKSITINEKKPPTTGGGTGGGSSTGGGTSSGGSPSKPNTKPSTGSGSSQTSNKSEVPNESNIENGNVKSSNNYLQSITLSTGNLSPEFYRETFEYTVENLPEDIVELEINATAEDERAHISGLGVVSLNPGENRIQINVTAENENVREYVLIVNRKQDLVESDLRLTTLEISQINRNGEFSTLEIPFDKETFEYNVEVDNDIVDLDVNPTVEREGIIVETTGEKNLKDGENIVSITLKAQNDQNIQTSYVVKVNRKSGMEVSANVGQKDETWKIVVIGISLLILVIEIIAYIWMRKHNRTL